MFTYLLIFKSCLAHSFNLNFERCVSVDLESLKPPVMEGLDALLLAVRMLFIPFLLVLLIIVDLFILINSLYMAKEFDFVYLIYSEEKAFTQVK